IDNLNKNNNFIINTLTNKTVNNSFIYEREIINFERTLSFYFDNTSKQNTYKIPATNTLRHSIIEGITELIAEIDTSWEEAEQRTSYDLFMENDVILTMGYSVGVEKFLKNVNKKKDGISVIVVGGDINRNGFRMAQLLSADGVDTTYISDSAVFAVIPKVTKVVLGSVAVSSSGGAITKIGGYNIACSAQFNSKPVTIVLPLFKLIHDPLYDPLRQNELQPGPSMIYNDVENLHVRIPKYDYIPEHLITLYITEMGPVDSFQLYNITKKKYHPDDLDLSFD
ncbi:eukaryotic translation initiation factor 2b, subunit 2, putative, partial [Plasmodium ovale curtisi]